MPSHASVAAAESAVGVAPVGDRRRILCLFAHPSLERSEANRPLVAATARVEGVTLVDLYAEYPTSEIDADREQARLCAHDVICFMHPLYWYSTPSILKEWQDLVLEHGFAYGAGANALQGKLFFNALTAGGPEPAYCAAGYNHFTIRELLCPMEQMARLCGMVFLPPFALFSARTAVEEGRLAGHVADWVRVLEALRDDRLDLAAALPLAKLNADLDAILRGG
ncbi:MAG TPA: NAD(P)H-dependent oxidoreductase [Lamprocystis sp. (in: g-proteobacteria)]|nr:NAD(P)H-dependent oxidoreductase [Lamprocystis sp. (in: g-proteobacteria)]